MKRRVLSIAILLTICVTGCGAPEDSDTNNQVETTVEDTVEFPQSLEEEKIVEEITEEVVVEEHLEDQTTNLSNEDWVRSLNVERPTFLIFNEITGERKALEDSAEYTLVEGDELGIIVPSRWLWQGDNIRIYDTTELKYNCLVYILNYDMISEKTEFTTTYNNREGQPVTVTVYLSK